MFSACRWRRLGAVDQERQVQRLGGVRVRSEQRPGGPVVPLAVGSVEKKKEKSHEQQSRRALTARSTRPCPTLISFGATMARFTVPLRPSPTITIPPGCCCPPPPYKLVPVRLSTLPSVCPASGYLFWSPVRCILRRAAQSRVSASSFQTPFRLPQRVATREEKKILFIFHGYQELPKLEYA